MGGPSEQWLFSLNRDHVISAILPSFRGLPSRPKGLFFEGGREGVTSRAAIALNPNSEIGMGARPPRAQFSAPSRKTRAHRSHPKVLSQHAPGRRCPASEFGLKTAVGARWEIDAGDRLSSPTPANIAGSPPRICSLEPEKPILFAQKVQPFSSAARCTFQPPFTTKSRFKNDYPKQHDGISLFSIAATTAGCLVWLLPLPCNSSAMRPMIRAVMG